MRYADDPAYWALQQLRSGPGAEAIADALERWSGRRPVVRETSAVWTSYRPFEETKLVLRVNLEPHRKMPRTMDILFEASASAVAFDEAIATCQTVDVPPGVLPSFVIRPWRTIARVLPYVPQPAALRQIMEPQAIASMLGPAAPPGRVKALELLRYVPSHGALLSFRIRRQTFFAKTFACAERHRRSEENLERVADLPVRVPRLVASAPELNTSIMQGLSGAQLSGSLTQGSSQALVDAGTALAMVHQACPRPEETRCLGADLEDIDELLATDLAPARARLSDRVAGLVDRLKELREALGETEPVAIHGNMIGDHVLYEPKLDTSIAILDWDDLTGGDPHFDLGRLIAHLLFAAADGKDCDPAPRVAALLHGYEQGGRTVDDERLRWHIAAALLLRGKTSLLRCLAPDWEARLEALVDVADAVLDERPTQPLFAAAAIVDSINGELAPPPDFPANARAAP